MNTFRLLKTSSVKHAALTLFTFTLLTAAFGQGSSGTNPGKGPKGNNGKSDAHNPNARGLFLSSDNLNTTMLTPTAWGSTENFAFATAGGTPNQLYSNLPDLAFRAGVGFGNYRKSVSVVGIVNVNDVSKASNLSYSFIASRAIGKNSSISAGALHLFADRSVSDAGHSLYAAYSWAARGMRSVTPGNPRLSFTIGAGSGAFYDKSTYDVESGKGNYGTGVFGSISYDVIKNLSVNAEWNGMNLGFTSGYRIGNIATVYAGVADITRYTGDAPTFVFGLGRAFAFKK